MLMRPGLRVGLADLPGGEAVLDYTYLWASGLSDTQKYTWSEELCRALDLPAEKLPRIVKSSDITSGVCRSVTAFTDHLDGTPIIDGAGDQSAGFI